MTTTTQSISAETRAAIKAATEQSLEAHSYDLTATVQDGLRPILTFLAEKIGITTLPEIKVDYEVTVTDEGKVHVATIPSLVAPSIHDTFAYAQHILLEEMFAQAIRQHLGK